MVVAKFESRREVVRIKQPQANLNLTKTKWSWLNLNPGEAKRLWPNLNLEEGLFGLNGHGQI